MPWSCQDRVTADPMTTVLANIVINASRDQVIRSTHSRSTVHVHLSLPRQLPGGRSETVILADECQFTHK